MTESTPVTEIRVHGVSGTPPASILKTQPILSSVRPVDPGYHPNDPTGCGPRNRAKGRPPIEVWNPAPLPSDTEDHTVIAYNWSRLTSGRRRHAFWLLLLPYTLANVAGWMLPPRVEKAKARAVTKEAKGRAVTSGTGRMLDLTVRLAGAVVTAIFALFTAAIVLDLILAKCQPGSSRCAFVNTFPASDPGVWLAVGAGVTVLIVAGVVGLVSWEKGRGNFARLARGDLGVANAPTKSETEKTDPALLNVSQRTFWMPRSLSAYLALLHGSAAAVAVAWVLIAIRLNTSDDSVPLWAALAASLYVALGFVAASYWAASDRLKGWAYGAVPLSLVALIVAIVDVTQLSERGWDEIAVAEGLSAVSVVLTLAIAAFGSIVWLVGAPKRLTTSGAAAMIVLAGLLGSTFGAGAYMLVRQFLIGGQSDVTVNGRAIADVVTPLGGIDWAAFGFLAFLLIQIGAVLATMVLAKLEPSKEDPYPSAGLRKVTDKVRGHLKFPAGLALLGGAVFLYQEVPRLGDEVRSPFEAGGFEIAGRLYSDFIILALLLAVVTLALRAVYRYSSTLIGIAASVVVVAAVAGLIVYSPEALSLAGFTLEIDTFRNLAVSLALLVPAGFVVSRVWTMLRDQEQRRGIGILWDLGSFWPRWYHPFSAPPYTPVAIPDLAGLVRRQVKDDGRVVLAAHSQGAVIAMAALLTINPKEEAWDRIALLTYGNPVCQLYENLFPAQFNERVITDLAQRLTSEPGEAQNTVVPRWWNLWRQTDPIGGPIDPLGNRSVDIAVCLRDGHSGYELTEVFRNTRDCLVQELSGTTDSAVRRD